MPYIAMMDRHGVAGRGSEAERLCALRTAVPMQIDNDSTRGQSGTYTGKGPEHFDHVLHLVRPYDEWCDMLTLVFKFLGCQVTSRQSNTIESSRKSIAQIPWQFKIPSQLPSFVQPRDLSL
jgi:hypothetical protein